VKPVVELIVVVMELFEIFFTPQLTLLPSSQYSIRTGALSPLNVAVGS
jgi:hypothetical protein